MVLIAFVALASTAHLHYRFTLLPSQIDWPSTLAIILAGLAGLYLVFGRKVATIRLYSTQAGGPLPIMDTVGAGPPIQDGLTPRRAKWESVLKMWFGALLKVDPYTFHIAIRATEPNVAARLQRYAENATRARPTRYRSLELGVRAFFAQTGPVFRRNRRLVQETATHQSMKQDIWPLVRLCVGRTLYPRPKNQNHTRAFGEEAAPPKKAGDHAYFTFKLHLVPLLYWFLLASFIVFLPSIPAEADTQKWVLRSLVIMPIAWACHALWFHLQAVQRWHRWLSECGLRPMGKLPLFLYCPKNDPKYSWEELDEFDFEDHIEEYALHTKKMFEIVVASFAFAALALLEVVGGTL